MLARALAIVALLALPLAAASQTNPRHFTFHYGFTVRSVPKGGHLRVWFPRAQSDTWQDVRIVSASGDLPLRKTREREYGNTMFYAETAHASRSEYHFDVTYDVVRRERVALAGGRYVAAAEPQPKPLSRFLAPDRLVPISGTPAQLAAQAVVAGKSSELDRVRAMYDYVLANMRYDKSGTGWGRGDVLYACDAKRGNCTDFHSLFISMARSQHIPARFEIGFPLPSSASSGEIPGYHCWTDFYLEDKGWVPLDISEAWKAPKRRDYFFGSLDPDRVQFSLGRDLTLSPPQRGEPLNYFVYPYVEVDGAAHPDVSTSFSFANAPSAATAQLR